MNRNERRLREKRGEIVNKDPVINIKVSEIERMKIEAVNKAVEKAFMLMLGLPIIALKDKHGWGKVRCERLTDQILDIYDAFNEGYVTLDDIHKVLFDESGIKITRGKK